MFDVDGNQKFGYFAIFFVSLIKSLGYPTIEDSS